MPFINGIGPGELIIILVIALIVVGPGKLPDVGSALGKSIREFRKAATDVKEATSLDPVPATPAPAPAPQPAAPAPAPAVTSAPPVPAIVAAPAAAALAAEAAQDAVDPAPPAATGETTGEWPTEVTPVDEQQPAPSA